MRWRLWLTGLAFVLLLSACSNGSSAESGSNEPSVEAAEPAEETGPRSISIDNQGGDLEGHTPRGFPGSGTGLFTGDNLNPNFPNGEGIQILLTFDLPDDVDEVFSASLTSDVMEVRGDPFTTLGVLKAEPVTYSEFGPPLFELAADGDAVDCLRVGQTGLICDVSDAAAAGVAAGRDQLQFRIQFENPSDNDGEQDLALFYRTDTNTNEPGIFSLNVER